MDLFWVLSLLTALLTTIASRIPASTNLQHHIRGTVPEAIFQLNGAGYFADVRGEPDYIVSASSYSHVFGDGRSGDTHRPAAVFVFDHGDSPITAQMMERKIVSYLSGDDVLNTAFFNLTVITSIAGPTILEQSAIDYLKARGASAIIRGWRPPPLFTIQRLFRQTAHLKVSPGPYLAKVQHDSIELKRVWRLQPDTYQNFIVGTYMDSKGNHNTLDHFFTECDCPAIPVPSRLYSLHDTRPFAGLRIGLKDSFDVKGLKTSGGSRAWLDVFEPANETAPAVQRLVDLGAVIIGKQKLSQFSSGAMAEEWEDFDYPQNPRGDGMLSCSASSSAGGCSVAAYPFLDVSLGSDTGGSIRMPASDAGVYGNRPSQGLMSTRGIMPLGHSTDTIGAFSRSPEIFASFSKHWYTPELGQDRSISGLPCLPTSPSKGLPRNLLIPDDYLTEGTVINPAAREMIDKFVHDMSRHFQLKTRHFNITHSILNASNTVAADLQGRLNDVLVLNGKHSYEDIYRPLIEKWAAKYDGQLPPVDPDLRNRLPGFVSRIQNEHIQTIERTQAYETAVKRKSQATEWFETSIFTSSVHSCSDSIMLYHNGGGGLPSYRDKAMNRDYTTTSDTSYSRPLQPGTVMIPSSICSLHGCADLTLPIGQVDYFSRVTRRVEKVPVTVNLVVRRGCDAVLFELVKQMATEGILKTVKTGRTAF